MLLSCLKYQQQQNWTHEVIVHNYNLLTDATAEITVQDKEAMRNHFILSHTYSQLSDRWTGKGGVVRVGIHVILYHNCITENRCIHKSNQSTRCTVRGYLNTTTPVPATGAVQVS